MKIKCAYERFLHSKNTRSTTNRGKGVVYAWSRRRIVIDLIKPTLIGTRALRRSGRGVVHSGFNCVFLTSARVRAFCTHLVSASVADDSTVCAQHSASAHFRQRRARCVRGQSARSRANQRTVCMRNSINQQPRECALHTAYTHTAETRHHAAGELENGRPHAEW